MSDRTGHSAPGAPWDALARRGERRGADAVLTAAVARAESASDGVPVADLAPRDGSKRGRRGRRTFGIVGIAALLGAGGYAIAGVQGNGTGGDSPAAVVQQLADAIGHEDALAAVAALDPSEISTLQSTVGKAEHKAKDTKLVDSSSAPFAGIDFSVNGLQTSVTSLAGGVAKVTLSGSISAKVSAGQLSEVLQRVAGNAQGSVNLARLGASGGAPFVVTVERDGKWYVSPMYTAFEYVRSAENLPPADFGSANASKLGATSPDGAVEQLIRAIGAGDWNTVASLAPPDQFPLYEYRAAFAQLMGNSLGSGQHFTVDHVVATPHAHGTNATVDVTASGTYPGTDYRTGAPATEPWKLVDGCVTGDQSYQSARGVVEGASYPIGNLCLLDHGPLPIGSGFVTSGPTPVHAVEESGRWYVSPVGTALDYLDRWVANFDDNTLASLLHQPLIAPVTGPLTLDRTVKVGAPADAARFAYVQFAHYTLHVDGPAAVVVDTRGNMPNAPAGISVGSAFATSIYGPDGHMLTPDSTWTRYHLPAAGTYDVITERAPYATLTVWRAADAPKDVPTGEPGCNPTPNGGEECYSSGSSSSSSSSTSVPPVTIQVRPTVTVTTGK